MSFSSIQFDLNGCSCWAAVTVGSLLRKLLSFPFLLPLRTVHILQVWPPGLPFQCFAARFKIMMMIIIIVILLAVNTRFWLGEVQFQVTKFHTRIVGVQDLLPAVNMTCCFGKRMVWQQIFIYIDTFDTSKLQKDQNEERKEWVFLIGCLWFTIHSVNLRTTYAVINYLFPSGRFMRSIKICILWNQIMHGSWWKLQPGILRNFSATDPKPWWWVEMGSAHFIIFHYLFMFHTLFSSVCFLYLGYCVHVICS